MPEIRVRSCSPQTVRLREWAGRFGERTWAVESAHGLGYLLAQQLVAAGDIDRYNDLIDASKHRISAAIAASGTSLTSIRGVGPITAAVIGQSGNIDRFASKHHYASYNATAPVEASSGPKIRHRLNPRGNRQLNWAIQVVAISQLRHDSSGREFYDRKIAEGRTSKEAIRALKRRLSDVIYRSPTTPTNSADDQSGPGRTPRNDSASSVTGLASWKPALRTSHFPDPTTNATTLQPAGQEVHSTLPERPRKRGAINRCVPLICAACRPGAVGASDGRVGAVLSRRSRDACGCWHLEPRRVTVWRSCASRWLRQF